MGKPENPPAFPFPELRDSDGCGLREGSAGMTLRDWFAPRMLPLVRDLHPDWRNVTSIMREAYRLADAMLAARALPNPDTEGQDK